MTSSSHFADRKGDSFERAIYPVGFFVIVLPLLNLNSIKPEGYIVLPKLFTFSSETWDDVMGITSLVLHSRHSAFLDFSKAYNKKTV